ncbi:MAG TPA: YvrJ family protein [Firmicutes bacterium]|nr:YvrJ family protein [Bacillota bacterium]
MEQTVFNQIANLGFPVVVSIYLLVRMEAKLDELTKSIAELAQTISSLRP